MCSQLSGPHGFNFVLVPFKLQYKHALSSGYSTSIQTAHDASLFWSLLSYGANTHRLSSVYSISIQRACDASFVLVPFKLWCKHSPTLLCLWQLVSCPPCRICCLGSSSLHLHWHAETVDSAKALVATTSSNMSFSLLLFFLSFLFIFLFLWVS